MIFLSRNFSNADFSLLKKALDETAALRGGADSPAHLKWKALGEKIRSTFANKEYGVVTAADGAEMIRALRISATANMLAEQPSLDDRSRKYDQMMKLESELRRRYSQAFGSSLESFPIPKRDLLFPRGLYIEPTGACNLRCSFCPTYESEKAKVLLDWDLFKRIVDEATPHGPRDFMMHKDGEPFIHPRFLDMLEYIKSQNSENYINFSTNGHFLKDGAAERLVELQVDRLVIGLRAATAETYKKIHEREGYEKVVENIKRLLAAKARRGSSRPKVVVQIVECDLTRSEIEVFVRQWRDCDVDIEIKSFQTWGGARTDSMATGVLSDGMDSRYPCLYLWKTFAINADGIASMCCYDWNVQNIVGDVKTQTVQSIWHGEKMRSYRRIHLLGRLQEVPLCDKCVRWQSFEDAFHVGKGGVARSATTILRSGLHGKPGGRPLAGPSMQDN